MIKGYFFCKESEEIGMNEEEILMRPFCIYPKSIQAFKKFNILQKLNTIGPFMYELSLPEIKVNKLVRLSNFRFTTDLMQPMNQH